MRRMLVLVAMTMAACTGGDEVPQLHDVVECSVRGHDGTFESCEYACSDLAARGERLGTEACTGTNPTGLGSNGATTMHCSYETVYAYRGVPGCCAYDGSPADDGSLLRFFACE